MTRIRDLAKDTLIYGLSVVLNPLIQTFVLLRLLTGVLNTYQYGAYSYFYAVAGILVILYSMRMETTYFRMNADSEEQDVFRTAMSTVVGFSMIFSLILVLLAPQIAFIFDDPAFARYTIYLAIILFLDAFTAIPFARLRYQEKSLRFSLLKIINVLVTLLLIIVYLLVFPRLNGIIPDSLAFILSKTYFLDGIFIANALASLLIAMIFADNVRHIRFIKMNRTLFFKMFHYTWPLIIIGISGNANQLLDRILMPFLSGTTMYDGFSNTGVYGGATKIAAIMLLFTKAFNYAFDPYIFKRYKENKNTEIFADIAYYFTVISGIVFVGSVALSSLLERLLGSNAFKDGMQYVPILLLAYFFIGLYYHFSIWYKLKDRTKYGAIIATLGMMLTLVLNIYLAPLMSLYGPPMVIIINFIFMSTVCVLWGRNFLPIPYKWGAMTFHVIMSMFFVAVFIWLIPERSLLISIGLFTIYLVLASWTHKKKLILYVKSIIAHK